MTQRSTRWIATLTLLVASLSAVASPPAAGDGLTPPRDVPAWPKFQWRHLPTLQPSAVSPSASPLGAAGATRSGLLGTGLVADWYLTPTGLGPSFVGGFRASSGLLARPSDAGLRPRAASDAGAATLPYLGLGYGGLHAATGWELSADLGLVATTPGAVRLGRSLSTGPALDELVRDLRLTPVLRLHVSYAF